MLNASDIFSMLCSPFALPFRFAISASSCPPVAPSAVSAVFVSVAADVVAVAAAGVVAVAAADVVAVAAALAHLLSPCMPDTCPTIPHPYEAS